MDKENTLLWGQLLAFTRKKLALPAKQVLTPDTDLLEDLGVDGSDGDDFMFSFCQHFQVAHGDLETGHHFGPEGFDSLAMLRTLFGFGKRAAPLKPITLGMLLLAAESGTWDSAALEQARSNKAYALPQSP